MSELIQVFKKQVCEILKENNHHIRSMYPTRYYCFSSVNFNSEPYRYYYFDFEADHIEIFSYHPTPFKYFILYADPHFQQKLAKLISQ